MIELDDDWQWLHVLQTEPERADEFKDWDRLGGFNIMRVLRVQPQLARYCDLKKLKPMAWYNLLVKQPQFAPQCDKWEEIRQFAPRLVELLHDANHSNQHSGNNDEPSFVASRKDMA
jgi:hypothetical protein